MSKDLKLKHKCPHYVVEEWLSIERDRQTLRTVRFPSSREIQILWNRIIVPPQGLFSNVEITGLVRGPFDIDGDTDEFSFSIDGGATQTVVLPHGRAVRSTQIARRINEETTGIRASNTNGKVALALEGSEPDSTLKMEGGSAHTELGFPELRMYRGRLVVPGWSLVKEDPRFTEDPLARKIVFDEPLRTDDDEFEVSYHTIRAVCRRCMGSGVENDFRHNQKGDPIFVRNNQLLLQEIEKIIFTIRGSNVFHRWYGTLISDMIGSKIVGGGAMVESQLVAQISSTIERHRKLKERQAQIQPVSRAEMLNRVVSIEVEQGRDPTVFFVSITLESQSGEIETLDDELLISDADYADGFQLVR